MPHKFRNLILSFFLIVFSIVLILLTVEFGSRALLLLLPELKYKSHLEFRKSIPAPYSYSDYNVKSLVDESYALPGWETPPGTRLLIPKNFHGHYISIDNGVRHTTDTPSAFDNVIYVFGGSTIFNNEVPDRYTVTSFLQRLVNNNSSKRYKVENYGATTVVSSQELERLKLIQLKRGDIVIFFDGGNDSYISIYNRDPDGWIVGENNNILFKKGMFSNFLVKIHTKLKPYSTFVNVFLSPYDYRYEPAHLNDRLEIDALTKKMRTNYVRNIFEAHNYSIASKAHFFHFLQPTIFSVKQPSLYEFQLRQNPYLISAGIEKALNEAYKALIPAVEQLKREYGVLSFDITNIFNQRPFDEEFFLDWIHVTEKGNEVIARAIFERIESTL